MNIKELRIGNFVAAGIQIVTIKGIHSKGIGSGRGDLHVYVDGFVGDYYCFEENGIEPIPLTEEWLIKMGFEKINYGWVIKKHDFGLFDDSFGLCTALKYNDTRCCPEIKYVHEVQNLYFYLTKEELNIKPSSFNQKIYL